MKKEEIHLNDVYRILFGNAPAVFLLEVFIRTLIIYLATLIIMRLLGKRMNGQLTIIEMTAMITMGAIIALPMQAPDRGILQGLLILIGALCFLRGINWLSFKSTHMERVVEGEVSLLVRNGELNIGEMKRARISRQQLFAVLRNKNIHQLGAVRRVYLEACGLFSIYTQDPARPGLPVYPPDDKAILGIHSEDTAQLVCGHCGKINKPQQDICPNCCRSEWVHPVNDAS